MMVMLTTYSRVRPAVAQMTTESVKFLLDPEQQSNWTTKYSVADMEIYSQTAKRLKVVYGFWRKPKATERHLPYGIATRNGWTRPALTPVTQTDLPTPERRKAELSQLIFVVRYIGQPRWFTCLQTLTHPGSNHLISTWPGVKPTTCRSCVQLPNSYGTSDTQSGFYFSHFFRPFRWFQIRQSKI